MFDGLLEAWVIALTSGFASLLTFSLPLLFMVAQVAWVREMWPYIGHGRHLGVIMGHAAMSLLSIVVYVLFLSNLAAWSDAAFRAAVFLGAQASGGGITADQLMRPSGVLDAGGSAATPILDFLDKMKGWPALFNIHLVFNYAFAYIVVIAAFVGVVLNIALTIIEFRFALLCATVLIPWAPLSGSAFLAEFGIGWLVGMIVRVMIQAVVVGVSVPLFEELTITTTAGGDPEFWGSVQLVLGSLLFFLLSWIIPNRAASIAGRGMALGIGGDALVAGMQTAARGVRGFASGLTTVTTGASRMMRQERAHA